MKEGGRQGRAQRSPAPFPWDAAMEFGLGVLRRSSVEFWAMTPRELHAAYSAINPPTAAPLQRSNLDTLMQRFPDGPESEHE
ncbi:MAG: rcc01693 family protein [Beijerinckiaceae bacterium]